MIFIQLGKPMLMDICNEAITHAHKFCVIRRKETCLDKPSTNDNSGTDLFHTSIIQLDHMRDKQNYLKILRRWCEDLSICGSVIFYGKIKIFLVLIGHENCLKSFQNQLKTTNVDVDSRGRPCKEKLSKVLCCEPLLDDERRCTSKYDTAKQGRLQVNEAKDRISLEQHFCDMELQFLYEKYINII